MKNSERTTQNMGASGKHEWTLHPEEYIIRIADRGNASELPVGDRFLMHLADRSCAGTSTRRVVLIRPDDQQVCFVSEPVLSISRSSRHDEWLIVWLSHGAFAIEVLDLNQGDA